MTEEFRLVPAGDSALVLEFEERIDPVINARAVAAAAAVRSAGLIGVRDVVPTFRTVAVYFDPLSTSQPHLRDTLARAAAMPIDTMGAAPTPIEIPVCYGGEFGPDLSSVAKQAGLAEGDVMALHASRTYRVYMLGFLPGFAYLGTVDDRIAVPRRATPRTTTPAGSVAVAGHQTGIYPFDTPGGWAIMGRTPVRTFDLSRAEPALFKAGDAVVFRPVERDEFDRLANQSL